jgi:hypothetical protein
MARKPWMVVVPVAVLLAGGGWSLLNPVLSQGADRRILDAGFLELEAKLGYHLYAPTWLPNGGQIGVRGALRGRHRVLVDYSDRNERPIAILAQEPRSTDRDAYNRNKFIKGADAKADVGGKAGYFITGTSGERRLFWYEKEAALILSSSILTDEELVQVAQQVR